MVIFVNQKVNPWGKWREHLLQGYPGRGAHAGGVTGTGRARAGPTPQSPGFRAPYPITAGPDPHWSAVVSRYRPRPFAGPHVAVSGNDPRRKIHGVGAPAPQARAVQGAAAAPRRSRWWPARRDKSVLVVSTNIIYLPRPSPRRGALNSVDMSSAALWGVGRRGGPSWCESQ